MAITQDYVSTAGIEGNDYKGASFTDGAYTQATKTLTKAGAFAATKVNHYIYITGTHITSGYYKVSDVSGAPNAVIFATDASSDGNNSTDVHCTQHDGSTTTPWRSLQGAFDLCTRNTTDGNQCNLKSGTAQVNAASLDLATFIAGGVLAGTAPLIVRGYTAAANDGGIGEIDCGGATMWAATTYDFVILVDLEIHTFGDNDGIVLDQAGYLYHCDVHKGASSPSGKKLVSTQYGGAIVGCHFHDPGAGTAYCYYGNVERVFGNFFHMGALATGGYAILDNGHLEGNIVVLGHVGQGGMSTISAYGNIIYQAVAGTGSGIYTYQGRMVLNNILCGFSGASGIAINDTNCNIVGYNAFWNNTKPYAVVDQMFINLTANDVTLAADPFVDAANGDFSLTTAAKAALRDVGWPAAYLGAHANTDGHITIGPIQYGAAGAGGGLLRHPGMAGGIDG